VPEIALGTGRIRILWLACRAISASAELRVFFLLKARCTEIKSSVHVRICSLDTSTFTEVLGNNCSYINLLACFRPTRQISS